MAHSDYSTADYAATAEMAFRTHVETYSFVELLGDLTGKSVLDAACGHGMYSRLVKQGGAGKVVGFDLSSSMIHVARAMERQEPLGIEYHVLDVFEAGPLGPFDIVTAAWLLPYATSPEALTTMAEKLYLQLVAGGKVVGIVPSPWLQSVNYTQYGMTFDAPAVPGDGDEYTVEFDLEPPVSIRSRIWTLPTLDGALTEAGFRDVRWAKPRCSPEGLARYGAEYWEHALKRPNMLLFTCVK